MIIPRNLCLIAAASFALLGLMPRRAFGQEPATVNSTDRLPQGGKSVMKSHKVWTEDDISAMRTPADEDRLQKEVNAAKPATDSEAAKRTEPAAKERSPFSNPKSVAEAEKYIAWDQRDLDSQLEYVERLRAQARQASGDERAKLEKELQRRENIVAGVRQELDTLQRQKRALEKPTNAETSAAVVNP